MSTNGTRYDFLPFDDDDDDEAGVATLLGDEDDFEYELSANDDDDDDDEAWDTDGEVEDDDDDDEELIGGLLTAAVPSIAKGIGSLFRGSRRRRRRVRVRRPRNFATRIRGRRGRATIMTRRGPVAARLQTRMVTPAELQKALAGVRRDIGAVRTAVRRVDRNAIRRDAATRKKAAQLLAAERKERQKLGKKIQEQNQQMMLMSLMRDEPRINQLNGSLEHDTTTKVATFTVDNDAQGTTYHDGNDLLPLMMMMGDGFGGGDMNPLMLMLLLDR